MMKCVISFVVVALGVRRLPGSVSTWEDVVSSLHSGERGVAQKVLSSLLQNDAESLWSSSDTYSDIITNLTTDIIQVIIGENQAAQNEVFSLMDQWNAWVHFGDGSSQQANIADGVLRDAIAKEKVAAMNYATQLHEFKGMVAAVTADCRTLHVLLEINNCAMATDVTCPDPVPVKVIGGDDISAQLNVSKAQFEADYISYSTSCNDQQAAIDSFWKREENDDPNAYEEVFYKRAQVRSAFNSRNNIICDRAVCTPTGSSGLQQAVQDSCVSQQNVDNKRKTIEATNATESLADRNYEMDALYTIRCLLLALNNNTNNEYDGKDITKLVDDCQQEGIDHENLVINFVTSGSSTSIIDGVCDDTPDAVVKTYNDVGTAMITGPFNVQCGSNFNMDIDDGGGSAGSIVDVVSDKFFGNVESMTLYDDLPDDNQACDWYCPAGDSCLQGLSTLQCQQNVMRIGASVSQVPEENDYTDRDAGSTRSVTFVNSLYSFDDCDQMPLVVK